MGHKKFLQNVLTSERGRLVGGNCAEIGLCMQIRENASMQSHAIVPMSLSLYSHIFPSLQSSLKFVWLFLLRRLPLEANVYVSNEKGELGWKEKGMKDSHFASS